MCDGLTKKYLTTKITNSTPNRNSQKGRCTKSVFLKKINENYCSWPIAWLQFNKSTDSVQYVNNFIVVYSLFLPQGMECKKVVLTFEQNLLELKYKVANSTKGA